MSKVSSICLVFFLILLSTTVYAVTCGSENSCTNNATDTYCASKAVTRSVTCLNTTTKIVEIMNWKAPCCKESLKPYGGSITMPLEGCGWDLTWIFSRNEPCTSGMRCFEGACITCSNASDEICDKGCGGIDPDCVDLDKDGYDATIDCNDKDPKIYPGAPELCDGKDNNCDGLLPANEVDFDKDGRFACTDCNDTNKYIFPDNKNKNCACPANMMAENCSSNTSDNNCNGLSGKADPECTSAVGDIASANSAAPSLKFIINSSKMTANATISFASVINSNNKITKYSWSFGDGETSIEQNPSHAYATEGLFTVQITITDESGKTSKYNETIEIMCAKACTTNRACDDNNSLTTDICVDAGKCTSGCTNINCVPACMSNEECDDGINETADLCSGLGTCGAKCTHPPASLEIKITSPDEATVYNTTEINLEYATNKQAGCIYTLNDGNRISLFSESATLNAKSGNNNLKVECFVGDQKTSAEAKFRVELPSQKKESLFRRILNSITNFFKSIKIHAPNKEKRSSILKETFGSDKDIEKSIQTDEHIGIEKSAITDGNNSVVSISINPDKVMKNVTIIEQIPKEVAQNVRDINFSDNNYQVINEDPLVMWHFEELKEKVEISYTVKGEVKEENLPSTVAIAQEITNQDTNNSITGSAIGAQDTSIAKIVAPLLAIPAIGLLLVLFNKFSKKIDEKEEKKKGSPKEELTRFVVNQVVMGVEKEEIKRKLIDKGWDETSIEDVFTELETEV